MHASEHPAPAAPATPAAPTRHLDFRFTGDGTEYFAIWMVNLLLSILTLGIYSAWAKVRREKYFHRHLLLDESGFDYHGEPLAILKGRAIAFGVLVLLSVSEKFSQTAYWLLLLLLVPALPWLAIRALRFRAHNTSYRGLRFAFRAGYRDALITFVGHGLLVVASLGLTMPLFLQRQKTFVLDHLRYGTTEFGCAATAGQFYRIFLMPVLGGVALLLTVALAIGLGGRGALVLLPFLLLGGFLGVQFLLFPYLTVRIANRVWNATRLGPHRFQCTMRVRDYCLLTLGNILMLILTLGLFWPWAKVRLARYRAAATSIALAASLDDFIAGETTRAPALGDEMAEMFAIDVAL